MTLAQIISFAFDVIRYILLAWIILSWIPVKPGNIVYTIKSSLNRFMRPIMAPFRKILPPMGGVSFAPILLFLVLGFIRDFLVNAVR